MRIKCDVNESNDTTSAPPRHTLMNLTKQTRLLGIFSNNSICNVDISRQAAKD